MKFLRLLVVICILPGLSLPAEEPSVPIEQSHWFVTQTGHFNIYSCAPSDKVVALATSLEQFREAYAQLAGAQAVQNPPITVMAFADYDQMKPFLPLYEGKPANLSGFFKRSPDENIIVIGLSSQDHNSLSTIYHEYSHLLFRRNDRVWPLWLKEGMAEIYSTFEVDGRTVTLAQPIPHHLRLLAQEEFMPLKELLSVNHDSPQYNEGVKQGIFYAESWLLTHFLMNGDNAAYRRGFANYSAFLRVNDNPEIALVKALNSPLPKIEAELHRYFKQGQFSDLTCNVTTDLSANHRFATRIVGPAEACFRLGNELLRIERFNTAHDYFEKCEKLAPRSFLALDGYGLLAAEQDKSKDAIAFLKQSIQRGSINYLAWYVCAREQYHLTAGSGDSYTHVSPELALEIRTDLHKSISLMPAFGPAQELLGFFELVQGENLEAAEDHLQRSVLLEPENQWYSLFLGEAQMMRKNFVGARQTLEPLNRLNVEPKLRARADSVLQQVAKMERYSR